MAAISTGFTVEDLDRLRSALGVAHAELDPWGNLIVTPASDLHEAVVGALVAQLAVQLQATGLFVGVNGVAWRPAGGSGYLNVPDVIVLASGWNRRPGEDFDVPPFLVVEVASPSTRAFDRGRKLKDYLDGGAQAVLLVDIPTLAPVDAPTFELHQRDDAPTIAPVRITLRVGGTPVLLDLAGFDAEPTGP